MAFIATLDAGGGGVFLGSGGAFTTVATEGIAGLDGVFDFNDPTLNDLGDVAFRVITTGGTGLAIYRYHAGVLAPVLAGGLTDFFDLGDPALNDVGGVAFVAEPTFGNQILTTSADLAAGRVVGAGDVLFGRTVQNVGFSREGLNDRGHLAFTAFFADGSAGVFLATPRSVVPEPAPLGLLAGVAPVVLAYVRRRWSANRRRSV